MIKLDVKFKEPVSFLLKEVVRSELFKKPDGHKKLRSRVYYFISRGKEGKVELTQGGRRANQGRLRLARLFLGQDF